MLLLISPAKTLDFTTHDLAEYSDPRMLKDSKKLAAILKKQSVNDLQNLMRVSEKIATLNVERFRKFKTPFNLKNAKQALFAFKGDVYTGLNALDFNKKDLNFAQKHLRILSGLYGVLKPLDLMQAYRLEMGTKLSNGFGKNLYEFWNDKITHLINEDLATNKDKYIVNLASKEYFSAINPKLLKATLLTVNFKEKRNDQYKIISFSAKKARGMMCHYIIKHKLKQPKDLKDFDMEDYQFNKKLSSDNEYIFTR